MSVREGHTIRKQLTADVPEGDGLPRGTRPPLRRGPRLAARTRGPLLRSVSVPEMPTAAPPGPGSQPERGGLRVSRRIPARRLLGFSRRARGFFLVLHRGSRDPWKHLEVASLRSRPRHGGPRGGACPGRDPRTQSWREQAGTVSAGRVTKPRHRGQRPPSGPLGGLSRPALVTPPPGAWPGSSSPTFCPHRRGRLRAGVPSPHLWPSGRGAPRRRRSGREMGVPTPRRGCGNGSHRRGSVCPPDPQRVPKPRTPRQVSAERK